MGFVSQLFEMRAQVVGGQSPSAHGEWSIFGSGNKSHAGVTVTPESALGVAALYACVQVLSQDVAKLPLITYRRLKRGKERATDWTGYRVLHDSPNPEMTSYEWREYITSHVAAWGNAYSEIDWSNSGTVRGLWPLRPDRMRISRKNGKLLYHYTVPNGQEQTLQAWRIHHVRGLGFDGVQGWSPVRMAMQTIGLNMAAEEYGARWYAGGGQPRVIAVHPGKLSPGAQDRLKSSLDSSMAGLSNSHRIKVLEEGVQLHKVGVPADEAQFIESQDMGAHQIARFYRMPPHKIALLKNATFSNIEHQSIEYVTDTLQPWLVRHEQALSRDLLTEAEQTSIYFEYLIEGLLRGDIKSRYDAYAIGRQWGWLSSNDIRERENQNPIAGGDTYLTPLNMTSSTAPGGQRAQAFAGLYEDLAKRIVRREAADLRRGIERHFRQHGSEPELRQWLQEFYRELIPAAVDMAQATVAHHVRMHGGDVAAGEQRLRSWMNSYGMAHFAWMTDALIDENPQQALLRSIAEVEQAAETGLRLAEEIEQICN